MPTILHKVCAYVTHGSRLLVFSQPNSPEAGVQIPAGSVEQGERLEQAVLREAYEETGLSGLRLLGFLGQQIVDLSRYGHDQILDRSYFHLQAPAEVPERWRHVERTPSDGSGEHLFELFWVELPGGVPPLSGEMGYCLPLLLERLAAAEQG